MPRFCDERELAANGGPGEAEGGRSADQSPFPFLFGEAKSERTGVGSLSPRGRGKLLADVDLLGDLASDGELCIRSRRGSKDVGEREEGVGISIVVDERVGDDPRGGSFWRTHVVEDRLLVG